ncbi:hypothetical protein ElyMa_004699400 [Elysia marginata]|uniref:Uncharacterized protein n=1 Tax=Elysia marginata TaxID=1093978 RepID=A0AAV4I6X7_9GAST|nr:hypothetical protein ElyMa_004699400 [Elysia marginata]
MWKKKTDAARESERKTRSLSITDDFRGHQAKPSQARPSQASRCEAKLGKVSELSSQQAKAIAAALN